jgi:hypothetical protein
VSNWEQSTSAANSFGLLLVWDQDAAYYLLAGDNEEGRLLGQYCFMPGGYAGCMKKKKSTSLISVRVLESITICGNLVHGQCFDEDIYGEVEVA